MEPQPPLSFAGALRVINSTDNFTFVQFDPLYLFDKQPDKLDTSAAGGKAVGQGGNSTITFSEFYDVGKDPWQQINLW